MAITYKNYDGMLEFALNNPGTRNEFPGFWKKFANFIRMAGYLEDVNPEAHMIVEDYNSWVKRGYL